MMSLLFGLFALAMWRWRQWTRAACLAAVGAYLVLELVMSRPAYYLISKFDLTGSSTGWYRSRLIESTIEHLSEWWLFGTDRTSHWMHVTLGPGGQQTDITNYYIIDGRHRRTAGDAAVDGHDVEGVPFGGSNGARRSQIHRRANGFMMWCLGAGLFAHACTSLSVAYFDQSMMFFWLNIAVISSMQSVHAPALATDRCRSSRSRSAVAETASERTPVPTASAGINPAWQRSRSTSADTTRAGRGSSDEHDRSD